MVVEPQDGGPEEAVGVLACDASGLAADVASVDALARLQLTAHRCGCQLRFSGVSADLRALLELTGLDGVLLDRGSSPLVGGGQPEQREEPGVEERRDLGDPPV